MLPDELEGYLHEHIPLSAAMGAHVVDVSEESVTLAAPLAPNLNHRETVFGGSASALAILSAWSLVRTRLSKAGLHPRLVIQRNRVDYLEPIAGDFSATAFLTDAGAWPRFVRMLEAKGRARVTVGASICYESGEAGRFEGDFVAITTEPTAR